MSQEDRYRPSYYLNRLSLSYVISSSQSTGNIHGVGYPSSSSFTVHYLMICKLYLHHGINMLLLISAIVALRKIMIQICIILLIIPVYSLNNIVNDNSNYAVNQSISPKHIFLLKKQLHQIIVQDHPMVV